MSHWGTATSKLHEKPLALVMIVAGLVIWIGGTWPNAIHLLKNNIRAIYFDDQGVTLATSSGTVPLGALLQVTSPLSPFFYARFGIETERGGKSDVVTSFLKGSQDRMGVEITERLRALTRRP
jgi:hypothetical protein